MAGVLDSSVGYTGGATSDPTYESVCAGDGHTEALRLRLDPAVLTYEELIATFLDDPRVPTHRDPREKAQYKTAIFAQSPRQAAIVRRQLSTAGKDVELVERPHDWYDAEEWHQHFYSGFKDLPDEI